MAKKFIDLSVSIDNNPNTDPAVMQSEVKYFRHNETFDAIAPLYPDLKQEDLPDSELWAIERISLWTHNGTHLDAPYHYASTMDGGKRAITVEEIPLDWCFRPGVKLDFRHLDDGYLVQPSDIDAELERIGYTLQPYDIVVVNTNAGERYGTDKFLTSGCGMGREATLHLVKQGIKVAGIDAWSWDAPLALTAQRYAKDKDPSIIWEGHKAGRDACYCHMEKLHNLECLPSHGFMVSCFPVKIKDASAGWTRAVAIIDE